MSYTPFGDWKNNAPPGLTAERMDIIEGGIQSAAATADEAIDLINQGATGITSVDGDVKRIYNAGTTPNDGTQPGDLVLATAEQPGTPADIPNLFSWVDASATGAMDLGTMMPDVSGNGNGLDWYSSSVNPASVSTLNGLPAFKFNQTSYRRISAKTGPRTYSGVFAFTGGVPSADQTAVWCSGDLGMDIGARADTGRLFVDVEGERIYHQSLAWSSGVAYVSFVLTAGSDVRFYLGGQLAATKATSTSGGDRNSTLLSRLANTFDGVWAEFVEHEHEATPSEVAALAAYYRNKWRV